MKDKSITSRQKEIIEIITEQSQGKPITVSEISSRLNLSTRTILREMPKIEQWLTENHFSFVKKPGVGFILEETADTRQFILELLEGNHILNDYSKEERIQLILGELLITKEPLKSFYFTSKFKISDATFSSDLDSVQQRLSPFQIELIRKQGLGVYIVGKEENLRQAIADTLSTILDENEIINILNGKITKHINPVATTSIRNKLLHFIDPKTIKAIETILDNAETSYGIKYADSAYIALIVHLSLAIKRIQNNENIHMDTHELDQLSVLDQYAVAAKIAEGLEKQFLIRIPEAEIGYITMHLKSSKIRLKSSDKEWTHLDIKLFQLASKLVSIAEIELEVDLKKEKTLIEDIADHLGPVLHRLHLGLSIKNPQLEEVKSKYTQVYETAQKACSILENDYNLPSIPEAEVGFLAMHLGAALIRNGYISNEITATVVCPSGIGTSKLLAVNLTRNFPEIEVKSTISAININIEKLKQEQIDIIFSTIPLDIDYKYLQVSPLLNETDKHAIQKEIAMLGGKRKIIHTKSTKLDLNTIKQISRQGIGITALMEHFIIKTLDSCFILKHMISETGKLFRPDNPQAAEKIADAIYQRELLAETYVEETEMYLFHCITPWIQDCRFGILRLSSPWFTKEKTIRGAVILLISSKYPEYTSFMSEISGALIENKEFAEAIKYKEHADIYEILETILTAFFSKKIKAEWRI